MPLVRARLLAAQAPLANPTRLCCARMVLTVMSVVAKIVTFNFNNRDMVIKWNQSRMLEAWLIMFSTLDTISEDIDKGNLVAKPLKKHQVDLDFNYDNLKEYHHLGLKWEGEVTLDEIDSEKFKKCSWAVFYYLTEVSNEEQLKNNAFIQMHKRFFINP